MKFGNNVSELISGFRMFPGLLITNITIILYNIRYVKCNSCTNSKSEVSLAAIYYYGGALTLTSVAITSSPVYK